MSIDDGNPKSPGMVADVLLRSDARSAASDMHSCVGSW